METKIQVRKSIKKASYNSNNENSILNNPSIPPKLPTKQSSQLQTKPTTNPTEYNNYLNTINNDEITNKRPRPFSSNIAGDYKKKHILNLDDQNRLPLITKCHNVK